MNYQKITENIRRELKTYIQDNKIKSLVIGVSGGFQQLEKSYEKLGKTMKVFIKKGEFKTVIIPLKAKDLAYYNETKSVWVIEEIEYIVYIGPSSKGSDLLESTFTVSN